MIKAIFYCDIVNENEEVIEEDFDFDEGLFENREKLDRYIKNSNYEVGEVCAYWGDNAGVLKDIAVEEVEVKDTDIWLK